METCGSSRVEQFDRDVARYEASSKTTLADSIKVGIMVRQLPESNMKEHLVLDLARLDAYAKVKAEVEAVYCAHHAARSQPVPMDLNALGKGKGKGKDKGKDSQPCPVCHKHGHTKAHWHSAGGRPSGLPADLSSSKREKAMEIRKAKVAQRSAKGSQRGQVLEMRGAQAQSVSSLFISAVTRRGQGTDRDLGAWHRQQSSPLSDPMRCCSRVSTTSRPTERDCVRERDWREHCRCWGEPSA
eukprot:3886384-Amphidinium_carterae.2